MVQPSLFARFKAWANNLRRDCFALYLAARDPRVPWQAKTIAALVAAYAFSPIDLIPDFIPIIGYLDDLILLPLGIALAIKLIPPPIMQDLREKAETNLATRPTSWTTAIIVVAIWILGTAALFAAFFARQ